MESKKPSYRSIVSEEVKDQQDSVLQFKNWDEINASTETLSSVKEQPQPKSVSPVKSEFLQAFADFITHLTTDVKEYYGFHGLANELSTDKVIDCLENSVVIDISDDNSNNEHSSDDEETFS